MIERHDVMPDDRHRIVVVFPNTFAPRHPERNLGANLRAQAEFEARGRCEGACFRSADVRVNGPTAGVQPPGMNRYLVFTVARGTPWPRHTMVEVDAQGHIVGYAD